MLFAAEARRAAGARHDDPNALSHKPSSGPGLDKSVA